MKRLIVVAALLFITTSALGRERAPREPGFFVKIVRAILHLQTNDHIDISWPRP